MAPALVRTRHDFVEYDIEDAEPVVKEGARRGFIERYIHSELLKQYSGINSVIHCHAPEVLPYAVSGVPFKPFGHMAGFLGQEAPIHDVEECYQPGDSHDLLINSVRLGAQLATHFSSSADKTVLPQHKLVLMRRHGFTTVGRNIKEAVYHAIYAIQNARLQTTSMLLRGAFDASRPVTEEDAGHGSPLHALEGLTAQQTVECEKTSQGAIMRPWGLWVHEVKGLPLYTSDV